MIDSYLAADVFWVTSLQDGMNLTAKEFIAAQAAVGGSGVLVLSRHTGAAEQLGTAALLTGRISSQRRASRPLRTGQYGQGLGQGGIGIEHCPQPSDLKRARHGPGD